MFTTRRNLNEYLSWATKHSRVRENLSSMPSEETECDISLFPEAPCNFTAKAVLSHLEKIDMSSLRGTSCSCTSSTKDIDTFATEKWLINKLGADRIKTLIKEDAENEYHLHGRMDFVTENGSKQHRIIHEIKMKTNDEDYVDYF